MCESTNFLFPTLVFLVKWPAGAPLIYIYFYSYFVASAQESHSLYIIHTIHPTFGK